MKVSYLLFTLIEIMLVTIVFNLNNQAEAMSPSFPMHSIQNALSHWKDISGSSTVFKGAGYTNIEYVTYSSDGNFFNATLWLATNFVSNPPFQVTYGIAANEGAYNFGTPEGIHYAVEIQWNKTKWIRTIYQYSPNGDARTISTNNISDFYEKNGRYVSISFPLASIGSPESYKTAFYTQQGSGSDLIMENTNWVHIPPPEFAISAPVPIEVVAGNTETIPIQVNSTAGLEPTIQITTNQTNDSVTATFERGDSNFRMPSYGSAIVKLKVHASPDADTIQHIIPVYVQASFPYEPLFTPTNGVIEKNNSPWTGTKDENVNKTFVLSVKVKDSKEAVLDFARQNWEIVTGVVGGLAWITGYLTKHMRNKRKQHTGNQKRRTISKDPPESNLPTS